MALDLNFKPLIKGSGTVAKKVITLLSGIGVIALGSFVFSEQIMTPEPFSGRIAPQGTSRLSDSRLKHTIETLHFKDVLSKLANFRIVTYQLKGEGENGITYLGLIAQEVEKIAPELVGDRGDGYKMLDYDVLKWMVLQAIKELKEENDSLKMKTKTQDQKIDQLSQLLQQTVKQMAEVKQKINQPQLY